METGKDKDMKVHCFFEQSGTFKNELKEIKAMRDTALTSESYNIFNGECVVLERILKIFGG